MRTPNTNMFHHRGEQALPQPADAHYKNRHRDRASAFAKRQERKRRAHAQHTQAPTTAALFIASPGFEEDGGSNSSPKWLLIQEPADYSLMNKSGNTLQSNGKGTKVKPL